VTDSTSQEAKKPDDQMIAHSAARAWLTYKNYEQQGRSYSFFHGKPTSAGTLFWRFYEYPDKERRELTKQRDVIYLDNGDQGYERLQGTATEEDKLVQEMSRAPPLVEVVLREWLKDPQTVLLYIGHPWRSATGGGGQSLNRTTTNSALALTSTTTPHLQALHWAILTSKG